MFHVHWLLSLLRARHWQCEDNAPRALGGKALGTNYRLEPKGSSEERGILGWLSSVSTWNWRPSRFVLSKRTLALMLVEPVTGRWVDCPVRLREGVGYSQKGLGEGGTVIYMRVAAVQFLPLPALILHHSHCFGTRWNFVPYILAYAHNFLASGWIYLFLCMSYFNFMFCCNYIQLLFCGLR